LINKSDDDDGSCSVDDSADVPIEKSLTRFNQLEIGSFGPHEVWFHREVGVLNDSGMDSQMVNVQEVHGRGGRAGEIIFDENLAFQAREMFINHAGIGELSEAYDWRIGVPTEEELFGQILPYSTDRRPVAYRKELMGQKEEVPAGI